MRILHLTDFHFNEGWFAWLATQAPSCDLICYTGDFLDIFSPVPASIQIQKVTQWISRVAPPFLFCSGNHDVEAKGARDGAWLKDLVSMHRWGDGTRLTRDCSAFLSSGWGTACRFDRPVNVLLCERRREDRAKAAV